MQEKIKELENKILSAQTAYYNGPEEIMPDVEYDALVEELKLLDPKNKLLIWSGTDSLKGWKKAKHHIIMGSLDKIKTEQEYKDWLNKGHENVFMVQYKMDGASIEVIYKRQKDFYVFEQAITRGDGVIGDDITENFVKIENFRRLLPLIISEEPELVFRGELLLSKQNFSKLLGFKNTRNATTGIMKRLDGKYIELLSVVYYEIFGVNNVSDVLNYINTFSPVLGYTKSEDVLALREKIRKIRQDLPYDIDGLVLKEHVIPHYEDGDLNPWDQIAFKFDAICGISTLESVEWSMNGETVTPVGVFLPVEINGATITKASLYNTNTIKELSLKIGSKILVARRGDVIPKIEEAIGGNTAIEIPSICPACKTKLIDTGTKLYCPNVNCAEKIKHKIAKWVDVLQIYELGPAYIDLLVNDIGIKTIQQLYELEIWDLLNLPGFGEVKAEKVIMSIANSNKVTLTQLFAGFDIPLIGEKTMNKVIAAGHGTLEKILDLCTTDLLQIEGFGLEKSTILSQAFSNYKNEILKLINSGVIRLVIPEQKSQKLKGQSFCFTGELNSMTRTEAEKLVLLHGGEVKSSVSKKLTYLVTNTPNSGSGKNKKADEELVDKITEEQFLRMVNSGIMKTEIDIMA